MSSTSLVPPVNTSSISSSVQSQVGSAALSQLTGNMNTFLTMLTTQLQNQDPTQPMDTAQFTQQLVEYSQVEQQIQTNNTLTTMSGNMKNAGNAALASLMNQTVSINGSTATLANDSASWTYTLPSAAQTLQLAVQNSSGQTVAFLTGDQTVGSHTVSWNGQDQNGNELAPGQYTLSANAVDASGAPISVSTTASGTVSGVTFDSNGNPELVVGGKAYLASNIISVGAQATGTGTGSN